MRFVDTNIFLRFFLQDDLRKAKRIEKLFKGAQEGKVQLWTTEWIIGEIIWTLSSYYRKPKSEVAAIIKKIFNTKGLKINNKDILVEAIDLYEGKNIDFEDSINSILARENRINEIYSYDKDFDRITWLKRKEP